jgi:hypothetical protein
MLSANEYDKIIDEAGRNAVKKFYDDLDSPEYKARMQARKEAIDRIPATNPTEALLTCCPSCGQPLTYTAEKVDQEGDDGVVCKPCNLTFADIMRMCERK